MEHPFTLLDKPEAPLTQAEVLARLNEECQRRGAGMVSGDADFIRLHAPQGFSFETFGKVGMKMQSHVLSYVWKPEWARLVLKDVLRDIGEGFEPCKCVNCA